MVLIQTLLDSKEFWQVLLALASIVGGGMIRHHGLLIEKQKQDYKLERQKNEQNNLDIRNENAIMKGHLDIIQNASANAFKAQEQAAKIQVGWQEQLERSSLRHAETDSKVAIAVNTLSGVLEVHSAQFLNLSEGFKRMEKKADETLEQIVSQTGATQRRVDSISSALELVEKTIATLSERMEGFADVQDGHIVSANDRHSALIDKAKSIQDALDTILRIVHSMQKQVEKINIAATQPIPLLAENVIKEDEIKNDNPTAE